MRRFLTNKRIFRRRLDGVPAATRGACWMLASAALFSGLSAMIRHMSAEIHPFEIAFFRSFFGLLILSPWLLRSGIGVLRTERIGVHVTRCAIGAFTMLAWFYGLSLMPLADAIALGFTSPLFVTIGAALFLHEKVRGRRWSATFAGFIGALIMLRPGDGLIGAGTAIILLSALTMAVAQLLVKELTRSESTQAIVTYMVLFMSPLTLIPALFVWRAPSPEELLWLAVLAALATGGNYCMTRAVTVADASAVMPFDFARLPIAALIGFLAFAEAPDLWTWVGAAIIAAASVYISHREAKASRAVETAEKTKAPAGGPAPPGERI